MFTKFDFLVKLRNKGNRKTKKGNNFRDFDGSTILERSNEESPRIIKHFIIIPTKYTSLCLLHVFGWDMKKVLNVQECTEWKTLK